MVTPPSRTTDFSFGVVSWSCCRAARPARILSTVNGVKTSNEIRSRRAGAFRLSRAGHFSPSRTVPIEERFRPGMISERPSTSWMYANGRLGVSKFV